MNLNLPIIAFELSALNVHSHGSMPSTQLDCPLPRLYESGAPVQEGACYVCEGADYPVGAKALFICRGKPPQDAFAADAHLLWTDSDISQADLLNRVIAVHEDYENWFGELRRLVDSACSMGKFGAFVQERFDNPTMCFSASYRCLFHVPGDLSSVAPDTFANYAQLFGGKVPFPEGATLEPSSVGLVASDERFTKALSKKTPVKTGHNLLMFDSASQALFLEGRPVAWLIVNGVARPIDKRDESLLHLVAGYATKLIEMQRNDGREENSNARAAIQRLLKRQAPPTMHRLSETLRPLGWAIDDEYVCVSIDAASRNPIPAMRQALAQIVERDVPASLAVVVEGQIVVVSNLTKAAISREQLVRNVSDVVEDSAARVCVSRTFDDIGDLFPAYLQCTRIKDLEAGRSIVRWYDDFSLQQSLSAIMNDGLPLEAHYPEGLKRLMKHDRRKRSDLVGLLRAYLECDRSVVKTTRRTFTSKSTCIYRLNLIDEIAQFDLDDPSVRLELLIAFALTDLEESSDTA